MTDETVALADLKDVRILYKGDLHALARFLIRAYDAMDAGTNTTTRPTLRGLASKYSSLIDLPLRTVESAIRASGLRLGAVVERSLKRR